MHPLAALLSLLAMHLLCINGSHAAFAGPYKIKIKSMGNCETAEVADLPSPLDVNLRAVIRHNHTSRQPVVDFNITLANDVFGRGNSQVRLDVAKWDTVSGWREHFLVMRLGELCFAHEEILTDLLKAVQMPSKCPTPDGTYRASDAPATMGILRRFPAMPYGRYRAHNMYLFLKKTKGPQVRGCIRLVADVVPQNK